LIEHCWVSAQSKDGNYKDRNSNPPVVVRRRSNTSRPNKRRQTEESGKIFQFKSSEKYNNRNTVVLLTNFMTLVVAWMCNFERTIVQLANHPLYTRQF
jgi:hypothetical protein